MNEAVKKLEELLVRIKAVNTYDVEAFIDIKNKLTLYINKFFNSKLEYLKVLERIDTHPSTLSILETTIAEFKSLITTLIQDIELSQNEFHSFGEREKESLNKIRIEVEREQERIQKDANEIRMMREDLFREKERLIAEEAKFDEFKAKLEIADKKLDFQSQAESNKNKATLWAIASGILIGVLLIILCYSLDNIDSFSSIA